MTVADEMQLQHILGPPWYLLHKMGIALLPRNYAVRKEDIKAWRYFLSGKLIRQRGLKCEKCGVRGLPMEVHEGIVKRNEVSHSVLHWWEIFSEYNCFLLCAKCHHGRGLPREEYYKRAVERYGGDKINGWLATLPFRHTYQPEIPTDES